MAVLQCRCWPHLVPLFTHRTRRMAGKRPFAFAERVRGRTIGTVAQRGDWSEDLVGAGGALDLV